MANNANADKHSDKNQPNTAFKAFQPIQPGPPSINFWAQQNELSEMLKKNSAKAPSFRLQPSIINVSAFKETDKPMISEFSTNLQPSGRGRKPKSQHAKEDSDKKDAQPHVNRFELQRPVESTPGSGFEHRADAFDEDFDTEVKKKIKAHQFDSEAEEASEHLPLDPDFKAELCFIDKNHVALINRKISKTSKKLVDLIKFVKKRENDTNDVKTYACKYCPKVFIRRAALGGHTAKNHPHQSDSYRIRQESLKNRKIERERFDYFKTIEQQ